MSKILICGSGSIALRHYRNLTFLGYKNIIFFTKKKYLLKNYKETIYENLESALHEKPEIAFICNNTSDHIKTAIKCALSNCNIFIEKPISNNLLNILKLKKILKDKKKISHVGYMMRFHPLIIKLKKIINSKQIGKLVYLRSIWGEDLTLWHPNENYRRSYAGKKLLGGGPLITLSHDFDTFYWIFGKFKKIAINKNYSSLLDIDTEHSIDVLMKFVDGATGSVNLNYFQNPPKRIFELTFTKGYIEFDYYKNSLLLFQNGKIKKKYIIKNFDRNDMFIDEIKYFLKKIKKHDYDLDMINSSEQILKLILK